MIVSMTGYGKAEGEYNGKVYSVELRSVNNRYCEIYLKYPRYLASKEADLKERIKRKISRGKINASLNIKAETAENFSVKVNEEAAKYYYKMLEQLKDVTGLNDEITLDQLLKFPDVTESDEVDEVDEKEFNFICSILDKAVEDIWAMKVKEGSHLKEDFLKRIKLIGEESGKILELSEKNKPIEKEKILKKVEQIITDKDIIDDKRIEMELVFLSDKLDISEECTRLNSHLKYFVEYTNSDELAGRRLNFLVQEINREINTIASKSMSAEISQLVSALKEELEKIREQLNNVE